MTKITKNGALIGLLLGLLITGHYHLRNNSPLYNFFFSPPDLYLSLAETDFDLSKVGVIEELEFTTKYPGNHWISLLVEIPPKVMESYDSDFKVKISIIRAGKIIAETIAEDASFWFHGGPERSGFALSTYRVPGELPIRTPLVAKVMVLKESPEFSSKYGRQRLIVSKYSDE